MNLKTKTILVVDSGIFMSWALYLAQFFGKVYYYCPWQSGFPSQRQARLGEGFPGVTRVNYPQSMEDEVDLFVFLDVFQADWQDRLRKQGKRVWGAAYGEEMELNRPGFRTWCERNGLTPPAAKLITGVDKLRDHLAGAKGVYVKMANGYFRGDMETRKWKGEFLGKPGLDQLEYDLGPFGEDTEFVVEDEVPDNIELGEDTIAIDGQFSPVFMQGLEIKGLGLCGIQSGQAALPACLKGLNDKLAPLMKSDKYRGFFSMEGLYTAARKYFPTDPCCRLGSPSNELLQVMFDGWAETMWAGAEGELLPPVPKRGAKYGFVVMIYSESSGDTFQPLAYKPEMEPFVKLRYGFRAGAKHYAVPQRGPTNLAGIVGTGPTMVAAAKALGEHVKAVDGNGIEIATDSLAKMLDTAKKASQWGAAWTTDPLPTAEELKKAVG